MYYVVLFIVGFAQIESFVADLPSDMTVYPQVYKLNCTKIGYPGYDMSMSIGNTTLANYTGCSDASNTCSGTVLVSSTYTVRYTVNILWDGMTVVSNGASNQSATGDQMYHCNLLDNPYHAHNRIHTLTIKGNYKNIY